MMLFFGKVLLTPDPAFVVRIPMRGTYMKQILTNDYKDNMNEKPDDNFDLLTFVADAPL